MRVYARKRTARVAFAGGGFPQGKVGAQTGSNPTPRDEGATHAVQQLNHSQPAWWIPDGAAALRPPFRPGTYNQNWEGLRTWNLLYVDLTYPNRWRPYVRDQSTQFVLNEAPNRRGLIARRAPTPIAVREYALATRAASRGSYVAIKPKAGM